MTTLGPADLARAALRKGKVPPYKVGKVQALLRTHGRTDDDAHRDWCAREAWRIASGRQTGYAGQMRGDDGAPVPGDQGGRGAPQAVSTPARHAPSTPTPEDAA